MLKNIVIPTATFIAGFITGGLLVAFKKGKFPKTEESDYLNVVSGITHSSEMEKLYKKLIQKVHPDRNQERKEIAEEYATKLNNSRYNFNQLKALEAEITKIF